MNGNVFPSAQPTALRISFCVLVLATACWVAIFVGPGWAFAPLAAAIIIGVPFRHPTELLGATLLLMPFHFLPVMIGQFFSVPHMTLISACTKEIPFLLVALVLYRRNRIHWMLPDFLLLACIGVAVIRTAFSGNVSGLLLDFEFVIAYFLGRVTVLTADRERSWANIAVWGAAVISILGVFEVVVLEEGPRLLLYTVVTKQTELPDSFHATAYQGLRAASTLVGPTSMGAFCMIALIIWWVYSRKLIPGAIIAAGLIASVTRSAWIGTFAAVGLLAFRMNQMRRILLFTGIAAVLFVAAIPVLGLTDYLFQARRGTDESTLVHRESELRGIEYSLQHPFGTGAGTVGPIALEKNRNAVVTENTYLAFAAQYGLLASFCLIGFLVAVVRRAWRPSTPLAHVTVAIVFAFGLMMTVLLMQDDFRLGCWVWFPIGLFVQSSRKADAAL